MLNPLSKSRKNWVKSFQQMSANDDDKLMIPDVFTDESLDEWEQSKHNDFLHFEPMDR